MHRVILAVGLASAALLACYSGPHLEPNGPDEASTSSSTDGTEPAGGEGEEAGEDGTAAAPAPSSSASGPTSSAPVCTSKQTWTLGDRKSKLMHPGVACIECHSRKRAPRYAFGGTVFPTLHEKDDCYGVTSGQVVVTDAKGVVATATVNAAGNFYFAGTLTPPLKAKVVVAGKERAMKDPVDTGDCNSCHTTAGKNDAEGRIIGP